jgi:hypothetical protein
MVSFAALDHTGNQWLNGFDEVGKALFGKEASILEQYESSNVGSISRMIHHFSHNYLKLL